jgi:hypothetical protein
MAENNAKRAKLMPAGWAEAGEKVKVRPKERKDKNRSETAAFTRGENKAIRLRLSQERERERERERGIRRCGHGRCYIVLIREKDDWIITPCA